MEVGLRKEVEKVKVWGVDCFMDRGDGWKGGLAA
jgi:hypothetical protein